MSRRKPPARQPQWKAFEERDAYTPDPKLHGGLIRVVARGLYLSLGAHIDVEELEQEVALFILHRRHTYKPAKARFSTWLMNCRKTLYCTLRRKYLGHIRQTDGNWRGLPRPGSLGPADFHPTAAAPEPPDADGRLALLRRAMAHLCPRYRQLLRLRARGLPLDRVAAELGTSRQNTSQMEARALRCLALLMRAEEEAGSPPLSIAAAGRAPGPRMPTTRQNVVETLQPVDIGVGHQ